MRVDIKGVIPRGPLDLCQEANLKVPLFLLTLVSGWEGVWACSR